MKKITLFLNLLLFLGLVACGDAPDQASTEGSTETEPAPIETETGETPPTPEEAMAKVAEVLKGVDESKEVAIVNFRDLQDLLPAKLAGMPRTDREGETSGAMGLKVSMARAAYEVGDGEVEIEVVDTGGLGIATMAAAAWASAEVDREDANGYERTTTIHGYKGYEDWDRSAKNGSIALMVGERFVINIDGQGIDDPALLKKMAKEMNLGNLEKMAR
ncbi:MAG: hypothetical protein AAFW73_14400 [Bacteroidota bacterium]